MEQRDCFQLSCFPRQIAYKKNDGQKEQQCRHPHRCPCSLSGLITWLHFKTEPTFHSMYLISVFKT